MIIDLDAWDKLPTQAQIYYDNEHETVMMSSGLGGGKTRCLIHSALQLSAVNRHIPGGILAPDIPSYKKDILPEMYSVLEDHFGLKEGKHFKYHQTDKTWKFAWSNAPIYVFTGERPIAGPNLGFCLINEFSLIKYERIKEMLRRVRLKDVPRKKKGLFGTPEDVHGWLEEFVDLQNKENEKNPKAFKLYQSDTRENIYIDENYRAHLESMLDSRALQVFAGGAIMSLRTNAFYYGFSSDRNVSTKAVYDKNLPVYANLDFNVGRMTATLAHKYGKVVHFFDEIVLMDYSSDTARMAEALLATYPKEKLILTIDTNGKNRKTTGASDLSVLEKYGLNVRFKRSNPRMRYRQLLMNGKLEKGEILVHPNCKTLILDFKKVGQEVDFTKSKTDEKLTHASDTADYFIDYEYELDMDRKSSTIRI